LLYVELQRPCHRWCIWQRGFNIEDQSSVANSLRGGGSEDSNTCVVLLELRKVYEQRIDTGRTKESNYVVEDFLKIREVSSNGVINDSFSVVVSTLFQKVRNIILANIRAREKIFFILMLL